MNVTWAVFLHFQTKMKLFLCLILCHVSSSEKHIMKVFFTGSSGVPNFPEVVSVMMVNEVQTSYCDSNLKAAIPSQDWMKKLRDEDPEFWSIHSGGCAWHQQVFKEEFFFVKSRLNQTGNVHIFQNLLGCEWDDETGESNGFDQYGYNGEDYLVFHPETQTWIATKPRAVIIKHIWNRDKTDLYESFINQGCIVHLQKQLKYGRSSLLRTELPSVSLLQKTPSSPVSCHATGFYPNRAALFWMQDGEEIHENVEPGEILPNHDGTFQMSVDLNLSSVKPEDWRKYNCVFQLNGVKDDIVTKLDKDKIKTNWEKPSDMSIPIATALTVMFVILLAATGLFFCIKKKGESPPSSPDISTELSEKLNSET